jgi:hypothetical protein
MQGEWNAIKVTSAGTNLAASRPTWLLWLLDARLS